MFLTNILLKSSKAKTKHVLVLLESVASGHKMPMLKERIHSDKLEMVLPDPYVQVPSLYKEIRRLKSITLSRKRRITKAEV